MSQGAAGRVFNLSKIRLFVVKCRPLRRLTISSLLSNPLATLLSSYPGVPFFLGSPKHQHFEKLLSMLRSKLDWWKMKSLSFTGRLILANAWHRVRSRAATVPWGKLVWSKLVWPKTTCFIWRLIHRKTPTQAWDQSMGINMAPRCFLCCTNVETDLHLFFYCNFPHEWWSWFLQVLGQPILHPPSTDHL